MCRTLISVYIFGFSVYYFINQTLGDTNVHALSAILDDRFANRKFLRILGVGLHPGTSVHCLYDCAGASSGRCSSPAKAVILLAGGEEDYPEGMPWWRHQMGTLSVLLAICAGNSPVTGEFPAQSPVTRSIDAFFDLRLNKRWVNNRETDDLRRHRAHYDVTEPMITHCNQGNYHTFLNRKCTVLWWESNPSHFTQAHICHPDFMGGNAIKRYPCSGLWCFVLYVWILWQCTCQLANVGSDRYHASTNTEFSTVCPLTSTHHPLGPHICVAGSSLIYVMTCTLSGAKPLSKPIMTSHQSHPKKSTSTKRISKLTKFKWLKDIVYDFATIFQGLINFMFCFVFSW